MQRAEREEEPPDDFDVELAANVSRAFWIENRSKIEIAEEFDVSRFKVARLLDDARRYGVVHIEIADPKERVIRLAGQVRDAFGLTDVALSSRSVAAPGGHAALGAVAAAYIHEHVASGSSIGLGWGRTMAAVVGHLSPGGSIDVVQLAGGFAGSAGDFNGSTLLTAASEVLGGDAYVLHAPALVANAEARDVLRADHTIARTVAQYGSLDALVNGIGVLAASPCSPLYRGEVLSPSVHEELQRWQVVGDTCCHFVDARGEVVEELAAATGISVAEIRSTPLRIAVAAGADKGVPMLAAMRSGLPNVLITDVDSARALLAARQERDPPMRSVAEPSVLATLTDAAIVPVIVIDDASMAVDLVGALVEGGIRCAEITLRTEAGLGAITAVAAASVPGFTVGAGTVLSVAELEASVDAGATFVVSPGFDEAVVARAAELGVLAVPGIATATELQWAHRAGLEAVKFFPADRLGGLPTIASLAAPFPRMRFMPSGGVGTANAVDYLRHPAVFAIGGSWMAPRTAIAAGDFSLIASLATEAMRLVR